MDFITELVKEKGITDIIFEYKEISEKRKNMLLELKENVMSRKVQYIFNISKYGDGLYEEWFCVRHITKEMISITKCMDLENNPLKTYEWYLHIND